MKEDAKNMTRPTNLIGIQVDDSSDSIVGVDESVQTVLGKRNIAKIDVSSSDEDDDGVVKKLKLDQKEARIEYKSMEQLGRLSTTTSSSSPVSTLQLREAVEYNKGNSNTSSSNDYSVSTPTEKTPAMKQTNQNLHFVTPRPSTLNLSKLASQPSDVSSTATTNDTDSIDMERSFIDPIVPPTNLDLDDDAQKMCIVANEIAPSIDDVVISSDDDLLAATRTNAEKVFVEATTTRTELQQSKPKSSFVLVLLTVVFYAVATIGIVSKLSPNLVSIFHGQNNNISRKASSSSSPTSIYVSGGGFSGFWYTLGRLETIKNMNNNNADSAMKINNEYYCYSAGCLAVVASLSNAPMENVRDIAFTIQSQWQSNELHRYDVVSTFVDEILSCTPKSLANGNNTVCDSSAAKLRSDNNALTHPFENAELLQRVNILTTQIQDTNKGDFSWNSLLFPQTVIRKANTIDDLKKLLIQTTWIPYAVGSGVAMEGHMDGAFSRYSHPECDHNVGLTTDFDLLLNFFNMNLGRDKVHRLWSKGLQYGL